MTFGVYVHVPFCAHRCDYCAFATYSDRDHLMDDYVEAVLTKSPARASSDCALRRRSSSAVGHPRDCRPNSCCEFLTPSLAPRMRRSPSSATPKTRHSNDSAHTFNGGVKRMSFGVQSTQPAVLADLGRRHGIMAHREVSEAVTAAGFLTWNMDLIVGSRAESLTTCAARSMICCRSSTRHPTSAVTRSRPNRPRRSGAIRHATPTRTRPPTPTTSWVKCSTSMGICGKRSPTGHNPAMSAATITSIGITRTTPALDRPRTPTTTAGATGTCARPIATSN